MDIYGHVSSLVCLFIVLIKFVYSQNCHGRDQCSCVYESDSSVVDITSLGNNDLTPRFKDIASIADGNLYSYNPCFPFNEGNCQQVAACQVSQASQTDIGSPQNVQFQYDEAAGQLFVQYTEGGTGIQQTTTVVLICDPDACTPELAATGQSSPGSYIIWVIRFIFSGWSNLYEISEKSSRNRRYTKQIILGRCSIINQGRRFVCDEACTEEDEIRKYMK